MKPVLAKINDALRAAGREERFVKGHGDYYVSDVGGSSLFESELAGDNATLARVVQHIETVLKITLTPEPYVDGDTSPLEAEVNEPEPPAPAPPPWTEPPPPYVFPPDVPQEPQEPPVIRLGTRYGEPEPPKGAAFAFWVCPGCGTEHSLNIGKRAKGKPHVWKWNGSLVRPTFEPRVKVFYEDAKLCSFTVKNGVAIFHKTSTHAQAGKRLPLTPIVEDRTPVVNPGPGLA